MGIKKKILLSGFFCEYHKIFDIQIDLLNYCLSFSLASYADEKNRKLYDPIITTNYFLRGQSIFYTNQNLISEIYKALKNTELFLGSEDILEPNEPREKELIVFEEKYNFLEKKGEWSENQNNFKE